MDFQYILRVLANRRLTKGKSEIYSRVEIMAAAPPNSAIIEMVIS